MVTGHLDFLCLLSHLQFCGACAPGRTERYAMTLFHSHSSELPIRGESRFSIAKAIGRIGTALKTIHGAIVAAKLRRLRRELMFHKGWAGQAEPDATKFAQRPLILGDKWDF